jgi:MOSC domain-containing protein YiiM
MSGGIVARELRGSRRVPHVVSVNVSGVRSFTVPKEGTKDGREKTFRSGILKAPVAGRVKLLRLGLEGDRQADRRVHGGPEKAVYLYGAEHLAFWEKALRSPIPPGTLGENLTIGGFERGLEQELHAGDELRIGTARVQLTTPRQPCWKLEARMGLPGFIKAFAESGRIGVYARVLEEGEVGAGDEVTVVARAPDSPTLAEFIRARFRKSGASEPS